MLLHSSHSHTSVAIHTVPTRESAEYPDYSQPQPKHTNPCHSETHCRICGNCHKPHTSSYPSHTSHLLIRRQSDHPTANRNPCERHRAKEGPGTHKERGEQSMLRTKHRSHTQNTHSCTSCIDVVLQKRTHLGPIPSHRMHSIARCLSKTESDARSACRGGCVCCNTPTEQSKGPLLQLHA